MARRTAAPSGTQAPKSNSSARSTAPNAGATPKPPAAPSLDGKAPTRREPTPEQIRRRAYEIFQARGSQGGNADSDWLQAERELRAGR